MDFSFLDFNPENENHIQAVEHLFQAFYLCSNAISLEQFDFSFDINSMLNDLRSSIETFSEENRGKIILVKQSDTFIGFGGYKELSDTTAELTHYYISPQFRNNGAGSELLASLIRNAENMNYSDMVLESARYLKAAFRNYKRMGFHECQPYHSSEFRPSMSIFMEKRLGISQ